jgi:hypothetical protein
VSYAKERPLHPDFVEIAQYCREKVKSPLDDLDI